MRIYLVLFLTCMNIILFGQVNLTQGLKAYYPFNGNANDASGNNNNPIFNNAVLTADRFGVPNRAYQFNGVDNYMQIPNNPTLNFGNKISICAFVRVDGFYQGTCHGNRIVMKGNADYLAGNYLLTYDDNGYTNGQNCAIATPDIAHQNFYGANSNLPAGGYTPYIQTGEWYSVIYTCDGVTAKLYVNCELKGSGPANGINFTNSYDLFLGKMNNTQYPYWFNGVMDEVRIYNRDLNIDEVNAIGNCNNVNESAIINDYTPVLGINPCTNTIQVENTSSFNAGDTVLMIQMKGAIIDSSNTSSFGIITDYRNAGNYEFNYIKSVNGNNIELLNIITRQYDMPDGKVQLVRVPYFTDYTVNDTLTCLPWDGSKGGVLVFNVQNTLTLNANIDVSGKGFRGGPGMNSQLLVTNCAENNYYYPSTSTRSAPKGESITTVSNNRINGKGKLAAGGGGGLDHNSGGGGGANGGNGGFGGYQLEPCGNAPFNNRGIGGSPLTYTNAFNRIYMGSGGGAGHANNPGNILKGGANGGGIIMISANNITSNSFRVTSNGNDAAGCSIPPSSDCHDGMGGGGAGGTVLLRVNNYNDNFIIETKGGKGADVSGSVPTGGRIGPGGGGSGGVTWFSTPSLPANVSVVSTGGVNGVLLTDANNPWGATAGQGGIEVYNLVLPVTSQLFQKNIDSVRIKDSALSCTSFDFKGLAFIQRDAIAIWEWSFGDGNTANTQNITHTYTAAGTYIVKLVATDINGCKDSVSLNVTATVLNTDFTFDQDVCNPLFVQFNGAGTLANNPCWVFGDGNTATNILSPTNTYPSFGVYTIKYAVQSGVCTDTISKDIAIAIAGADIIQTLDTTICFGSTKQLKSNSAISFCWSPGTYLDDPTSANPVTSTPENITYYLISKSLGANLIVNGDFSGGNTGFTSSYTYFPSSGFNEGVYNVGANITAWHSGMAACPDHTTGNGNMMMVNGAGQANVTVWTQTVTVTPNTNYAFSTWLQHITSINPAQLQFSINGVNIGAVFQANNTSCIWDQFYTVWNSGNNTSATISIVNQNTGFSGNDFALDDISFSPIIFQRDSVKITVDTVSVRTSNDITICEGASVQLITTGAQNYSWTPAVGLSAINIANPVASPVTNTQYIVQGVDAFGCSAKDTVNIAVNPSPSITLTNDTVICPGTSLQLQASGGNTYAWTPAASLDDATISNPVASPVTETKYYVTVTDALNCSSIDSVTVSISPDPVFTVNADASACFDTPVQLNASGGDNYTWSPTADLSNSNIADPMATPAATTLYTVTITEALCNRSAQLSTRVTVFDLPDVTATKSNDIDCSNDQSQLIATGAGNYSWTPSATLNNPSASNPIAKPTSNTLYTVEGTDANGCKNTDTVSVLVTSANKGGYLMPTGFTPNNDGLNDCYGIRYWGVIDKLEFSIYNRWGEKESFLPIIQPNAGMAPIKGRCRIPAYLFM